MATNSQNDTSAAVEATLALQRMTTGHFHAQAIYVVAALGVADVLAAGPTSSEHLAAAVGAHELSLRRVMRLLASVGIFELVPDGRFALTEIGALLRTDVAGSQRARSMLVSSPTAFKAWGALLHTVKTGETAFNHVFGMGGFEYFQAHPDEGAIFNQAMSSGASGMAEQIVAAYDFARHRKVLDVGGGLGALMRIILRAAPQTHGIVFDLPSVADAARQSLSADVVDRCEVVGGDFFAADLPRGADAHVLKHVIHDWGDARALAILRSCERALPAGGTLLIIESVFPDRIDQSPAVRASAQGDVNMMVNTGGRRRTAAEFRALLHGAGLELRRVLPTATPYADIVEAVRAVSSA